MASRKVKSLENQIQFLLQSFSWGDIEEQMDDQVQELDSLLNQLQQCLGSLSGDDALTHKETFYHLQTSFNNIKAKLDDERKRARLLRGKNATVSEENGEVTIEMKRLLEENHSLHESIKVGNAFVNQAIATKSELSAHNQGLNRIKDKAGTANNIFGSASTVMSAIRRQKLKHTVVMGIVIGLCVSFLLWWWWRS